MLKNRFILTVLAAMVATTIPAIAWDDVSVRYEGDYSNTTVGAGYAYGIVGGVVAQTNSNDRSNDTNLVKDDVTIQVTGSATEKTYIKELCGIGVGGYSAVGNKTITIDTNGTDSDVYVGKIVGGVHYNLSKSGNPGASNPAAYRAANGSHEATGTKIENTTLFATLQSTTDKKIEINVKGGTVGQIRGGHENSSTLIKNSIDELKKHYTTKYTNEGLTGDDLNTAVKNAVDDYAANPGWAINEDIIIKIEGGKIGYAEDGSKYGNDYAEEAIIGAGGKGFAVNGSVEIEISGPNTEVLGNIYAGAKVTEKITEATGLEIQPYIGSSKITISGGTITGDVYGGGSYQEETQTQSLVKNGTQIILSGGQVLADTAKGYSGNVYAAGDHDNVDAGTANAATEIIVRGEGTKVAGVVSGGGNDSNVDGERQFTVEAGHDSTTWDSGYKLADFTDIDVSGKVAIDKLTTAAEGTDVSVNDNAVVKTYAGVLTGLDDLTVSGTLDITVTDDNVGGPAVSANTMSIDDGTINVTNNSSDKDAQIQIFNIAGDIEGLDTLTLAVDGQQVSADMWDATSGGITIKELSTATLGLSGNQSSFYGALKAMAAGGAADEHLADLSTSRDSEAVRAQIDMLSGHELATAMMSQVEGNMGHMRRLRAAIGNGPALDSYTSFALCSPSADGKGPEYVAPQQGGKRWRAGVQAYHEDAELDASSKGDGYDRSETGAMLTAEYFVNKSLTVGGALSCGRTTLKSDNASKRHEDNTRLDAFALYGKNRWQFATALGLGLHQHDLKRTFTSAEADGYSVNFMQDAAYTLLVREKSNVQAFATLASSWNHMDGYTEKGTYALRVDDQDSWTTDVTVGVRYNHALPALGAAPAGVFSVQAGVTGTLGDVDSETEMSLNGFRYSQKSASRDRWGWSVGASVDVPVRSNMSWYAAAEAVMRGDYTSVDGQVGVKLAF